MRIAALALLVLWAFFFEYIPPTKRVHVWSDIEGYHYPLLDYAHKTLWSGRVPLWDPSIYCGIPFAGNIQAGLFYPPNWLLFIANARTPEHLRGMTQGPKPPGMRFTSIEILAFLHVWIAFLLTYAWLRERTASRLPAVLGGLVAACSGYMLSQMNHLGVSCGFAWFPLVLWGIEQANQTGRWGKLWKVAAGSALCLFAGYPSTWVTLAIIAVVYAAVLQRRTRLVPLTLAALVLSVAIGAVQLLPAMEAARLKQPEQSFGGELPLGTDLFRTLLLPNWFDQNRTNSGPETAGGDYLYLGAPFLVGVVWLARRGWYRGVGPAVAIAGVTLYIAADPTGHILLLIEKMPVVPDVLRRYNLLPGAAIGGALLAASAADDFLRGGPLKQVPRFLAWIWAGFAALWCGYLAVTNQFRAGWESGIYAGVTVALLCAGLYLLRSDRRGWVACAIVAIAVMELQAFGTNRRFNAVDENVDRYWRGDARVGGGSLNGLDDAPYREMLRHPGYRVGLDEGPHSTDLRHYGLATLQGFDPFLTDRYRIAVERFAKFKTNRLFDIDPQNEELMHFFGVRWMLVRNESPMQLRLQADPRFRKLPPGTSFYVVYEYLDARPAWRFSGDVDMMRWDAEHRTFRVRSATGGSFTLVEALFPGWQARVDGRAVPVEVADGVFQKVAVPPGEHGIDFVYRPTSLYAGAGISLVALAVFGHILRKQ